MKIAKKICILLSLSILLAGCTAADNNIDSNDVVTDSSVGETNTDNNDNNEIVGDNVSDTTLETPVYNFKSVGEPVLTWDLGFSVGDTLINAYKGRKDTNPISDSVFFADPTSVEYNGRVYVYGTNDSIEFDENGGIGDNDYGSINSLVCYSSADMVNWQFETIVPVGEVATWAGCSWAPSIVAREESDGLTHFYLYFANGAAGVGVLTSTSPTGPWTDPIGKALVDGSNPYLQADPVWWCFDPGVVIDDNGVGWIAFGGGDPVSEDESGLYTGNCRFAKLGEDMISIDGDIIVIDAPYHFEANELNYVNGKYILTYCSNWWERTEWDDSLTAPISEKCTMCYMVSDDPLNPGSWVYMGEYLGNPGKYGYWFSNNHNCLQKFGNKWYVFYQNVLLLENMNHTEGGGYRSVGVNTIEIDEETATITYGEMSDTGVSQTKYVKAWEVTRAQCCRISAGVTPVLESDNACLRVDKAGSYVGLNGVNFGEGMNIFAATVNGKGIIEVRLDSPTGDTVGSLQFDTDSSLQTVYCELDAPIDGKHSMYLVFGGEFTFDSWQFAK